jgi:[acyl-carrier-protein] S-malonyltransferase
VTFQQSKVQVFHNVSASPSDSDQNCRKSVAEQLYRPVKWVDTIQALESNGADTIIEFGPGKVLFGLNRRINRKLGNLTIHDTASFDKALAAIQE